MVIIRYFKHLDFFGTMNVNPKWPKIKTTLFLKQKIVDWPNLVAHVFKLKSQTLLHDILKIGVFGQIVAHVYTIEFFKMWFATHAFFHILCC
jgi:hypothetical protein